MSKFDQTIAEAKTENLIDERNILAFANAKALPNGEFGLCLLCVNGNTLRIFDTDFNQSIGEMKYDIALRGIFNIKSSSFVLRRYLKFAYEDKIFHFADFGDAKRIIAAILDESENR